MRYIHELKDWPHFKWDEEEISTRLAYVRHQQGRLLGRMEGLGFSFKAEAVLKTLTEEVLKTSEIEGERLDRRQVRSSVARRLGMEVGGLIPSDRNVDGVVEMMIDATQNFQSRMTKDRLFGWHSSLFPAGRSGMTKIRVGQWRDDRTGPMQVISGPMGKERIHFVAPAAKRLQQEMAGFLTWFNGVKPKDDVLKSAIAHLWFVTVHPFEDGNGRIARALADMLLARADNSPQRFYSMSAQISAERKGYYQALEKTQKGNLEITDWLKWYLSCLSRAILGSERVLSSVLEKAQFWSTHGGEALNDRQKKTIGRLFDGFEGKLTSSKWAAMNKCSQDTAARDITDLVERGILKKNPGGGRSTSYSLARLKGQS